MFVHVTGTQERIPEQQPSASPKPQDKAEKPAESLFAALLGKKIEDGEGKLSDKLRNAVAGHKSALKKESKSEKVRTENPVSGKTEKTGENEKKNSEKSEKAAGKTGKSAGDLLNSALKKGKKAEKPVKQTKESEDSDLQKSLMSGAVDVLKPTENRELDKVKVKAEKTDALKILSLSGEAKEAKPVIFSPLESLKTDSVKGEEDGNSGKVRHLVVDLRKNVKQDSSGHSGASNGGSADQEGGSSFRPAAFQEIADIKAPENFEKLSHAKQTEMLNSHLRNELNQEIVKQTRFIINSENSGEIRLVLKPEHLGNVRIKINLEDNHIAGKILVENNIVKEAFEQNMRHLQDAFKQSGFESAAMDVSVEDRNSGRNQNGKKSGQHRTAAVENALPVRNAAFEVLGRSSLIDLTA